MGGAHLGIFSLALSDRACSLPIVPNRGDLAHSSFVIRISFGLRISAFGFSSVSICKSLILLMIANNCRYLLG
jgi:hypothetical protein